MATDPNSILAITQPTLEIRKISQIDVSALNPKDSAQVLNGSSQKTVIGTLAPYIEIDNYIIPENKIVSLVINQNGFLPELTVSFLDSTGSFTGMYFPKTNPVLKLYIKSLSTAVKPIRSDYLITNIVSSELGNAYSKEAIENMYTLTAKLYIPGLYGNNVQSIPNKKSWEALKHIADSLKLGFATNETSTDDQMTWINPNSTIEEFIKNIVDRAYKNDKSFFDCFIDVNYILNFVNYEKALSKETKVMQAPAEAMHSQYSDSSGMEKNLSKDDKPKEAGLADIVLRSSNKSANRGLHIVYYAMYSNHGEILANQTFRKNVVWHNREYYSQNKAPLKFYVEPLSEKTIDSNLTTYQKPKLATFNSESSSRWLGIDYDNAHANYKFARLLNYHNLEEMGKNYLVVKIPGVVQSIYRGGKLMVLIERLASDEVDAMPADERFPEKSNTRLGKTEVKDLYTSGPYIVKDIQYEFNGMPENSELKYSTELTLVRREWIELSENNKLASEKNI
jgi:hypothetical protein